MNHIYISEKPTTSDQATSNSKLDVMLAFTRANMEKSRCSKIRNGESDWGWRMDVVTGGYKFQPVNLIMFFFYIYDDN